MAEQNRINQKLKELLEGYKINLKETNFEDEVYKWEAIEHFKKFWDINADDFSKMFNQAFQKRENLFYQNSWGYIIVVLCSLLRRQY